MKNFRPTIVIFAIFSVACPENENCPQTDIPRISVSPNAQSCSQGKVFDPVEERCVPTLDFFESVCDDSTGDALVEVTRAEYCCFTENNYYYYCQMSPEYNIFLGTTCMCPDPYTGIYWNGIACGYGE